MMCSLSERPVMKITGTWASALVCLRRRQVSNPSVPGITASIRMTSGVTFSTIASASSPSRATSTLMPASSIASVRTPSVPGESSTTSTMFLHSFLGMAVTYRLQGRDVALEIERLHEAAHLRDEPGASRRGFHDGVELFVNPPHVADLAETDQLGDVGGGRNDAGRGRGGLGLRLLVDPLDVEERVDLLEQLAQVDRLHHVVVVQAFSTAQPVRRDGIGGQHQEGGAVAPPPPLRMRCPPCPPSMSGIAMSSRIRFGRSRSASARHSRPPEAVATLKPSGASSSATRARCPAP